MAALDFPNSPVNGTQYSAPNGAVYTYDGTAWTVSGVLSTGTAAGGELTGTYPSPQIAALAVTSPKLAVKATVQTQQAGNVPASFSTATTGSFVTVASTANITTRGGNVLFVGWISGFIVSSAAAGAIYFQVNRSGTTVSIWKYELAGAATSIRFPFGNVMAFDPGPAAGTYTYSFAVMQLASSPTFLTGGDNPGTIWAIELS